MKRTVTGILLGNDSGNPSILGNLIIGRGLKLYFSGKNEIKENEFLSPMYTYIMNKGGEIQYFIHEKLSFKFI